MKVLHLLASGGTGGIEILMRDYGRYSQNDNIFLFIWNGGITTEEMKKSGLHVVELNASKKDLFGPWKHICRICKDNEIGTVVVHHASPVAHFYLMMLKKKFSQIETVAYAHGSAENMRGGSGNRFLALRRGLIEKSLQKADHVVAISHFVKESLVQYYQVSAGKIKVIYNGVDVKRMASEQHKRHETAEIVYVGRLIEEKGVQIILQALAHFPVGEKWHLSIIGDGIYRGELEKLVQKLNLQNHVTFHGTCHNIHEILRNSDVFVHAPVCEEGFGITIVEAMAAGLLCVCAKSGAIPEIIQDKTEGFLFEKGNVMVLEDVLLPCIREYDVEPMKIIRVAAVEKAKHFSIEIFAEQLDRVLNRMVINTKDEE